MCALEFLHESKSAVGLQIFATDISDPALEKARGGKYSDGEVSEDRPGAAGKVFHPDGRPVTRSRSRSAISAFSPGRTLSTTRPFPGWT